MRKRRLAVLMAAFSVLIGLGTAGRAAPMVVDRLDVERYMGLWYAVASIPTSFERGCVRGTTAQYTLLANGQIEVLNTCYGADGKPQRAVGRAWAPDPQQPMKLKVSFVSFLGLWLFPGDYWVIDLDPDYRYAVVGHPSYRYGWILSRAPTLPEATLSGIITRLEAQGYRFEDFRRIDQSLFSEEPLPPACGR